MEKTMQIISSLFEGFGQNLILFVVTLVAAIPLGFIITLGSMSKWAPFKFVLKIDTKLHSKNSGEHFYAFWQILSL